MDNGSSKKGYLRAGELAKLAKVSTDTLRHYERKGLLPRPRRSANGYREYPAESLERVSLIRRALEIGFTLDELARIFGVRDRGGVPCLQVRSIAGQKLTEVEGRLRELTLLRDELRVLLKEWDARLAKTSPTERTNLLESLVDRNRGRRARPSPLSRNPDNQKKEKKVTQW